jgi:dethiobiotin synthetase/adenosylmethionine--8-amino-7-oxononanoate aminotransferase
MSITTQMISRRFFTSGRLPRSIDSQTHFIFGANTDVGKTVLSAGLVRASQGTTHYIKPLQCGGSDQHFIEKHAPNVTSATTLFRWETPASPHVASRKESKPVSDEQVFEALEDCLADRSSPDATCWVETAGGVLSPSSASPDNTLPKHACDASSWGWVTQGDLYQPFMAVGSVILVGDGRLGGISATLSALESLIIRGYDVAGIIMLETGYDNQSAIQEYASRYVKRGFKSRICRSCPFHSTVVVLLQKVKATGRRWHSPFQQSGSLHYFATSTSTRTRTIDRMV